MRLNNKAAADFVKKKKAPKRVDEIWSEVKNAYELSVELRRPFEQNWIMNLAFLAGRQYVLFNTNAHMIQAIAQRGGQRRSVDNILIPKWKRQVADLIKNDPEMSVVPNTFEDEDIKAAKSGDKAISHFWRNAGMKKKQRLLAGWIYSTGNAFLDDRWNKRMGPEQFVKESGQLVYLGDVDVGVWSPFEIGVPIMGLGDVELQGFPWVQKQKFRGLDYIRANYKRGSEVEGQDIPYPAVDMGLMLGQSPQGASGKVEGALLIEHYMQPCEPYPKGLFVVASNGVVLVKEDFPFNEYHLEQFKENDLPGVFWGKSTLEDAVPLQKRWNKTINSIDEFNRTMAKGKILNPKGSKMQVRQDDTHGEIIDFNPVMGMKPEQMNLKGLPQTLVITLETVKTSLEDLYSQHEVSRGTNRSDIRSGEMVSILREQDAHGSIPSHLVYEESMEKVTERVLRRMQKGYTEERMLKTLGRDGDFEVTAFKGADLRGNTDVHVKRQSSLPDSRVGREAQVMERYQVGLYGPPEDPEVRRHVAKMLDDAVVKDFASDVKLDEAYARHEQILLSQGNEGAQLVNSYDDHALHVKEHNHYRKSMDYQAIKFQDPQQFMRAEVAFGEHLAVHQKYLAEAMAQQMKVIQMSGGGGGGQAQAQGQGGR